MARADSPVLVSRVVLPSVARANHLANLSSVKLMGLDPCNAAVRDVCFSMRIGRWRHVAERTRKQQADDSDDEA